MKKMKRIMCLLLAMVLVLGMSMTVFATEETSGDGTTPNNGTTPNTYTISVPGDDGHTYAVYQIFTGDWSEGDILANLKWGANSNPSEGAEIGDKVASSILDGLKAKTTDKDVVKYLETYVNLKSTAFGTVSNDSPLEEVPAGYYLIKDNEAITGDDAATLYIVQVVGPTEIKRKAAQPTVDKEVSNGSDSWGETADHAINEPFQFTLTATVPADVDLKAYDTYKLVFRDTMSSGITFDGIESVQAIVGDVAKTIEGYQLSDSAVEGAAGITWTLTIENLKAIVGDDFGTNEIKVVVTYNVHLNEKAEKHKASGSVDENSGNYNKVQLEYSNNPNSEGTGTGTTEEDHVFVFTFEVDNKKTGEDNKPLEGAGFRLYTKDGDEVGDEVTLIFDEELKAYRPTKDGEVGEEMFSAGEGAIFNIVGLKAGEYILRETTTPEGYNTCDDFTIKISATHEEVTDGSAKLEITTDSNLDNTIENHKGSLLPETGGIGTRIFYILGGILVVGCGVILVTRKRVGKQSN